MDWVTSYSDETAPHPTANNVCVMRIIIEGFLNLAGTISMAFKRFFVNKGRERETIGTKIESEGRQT